MWARANLDYYSDSLYWSRRIVWSEVVSSAEFQGGPHPSSRCAPGCPLPAPSTFQQVAPWQCGYATRPPRRYLPFHLRYLPDILVHHTTTPFLHMNSLSKQALDSTFNNTVTVSYFFCKLQVTQTKKEVECCVDVRTCELCLRFSV